MGATCVVCAGRTLGRSDCGSHPRLLVEAVWGEGAQGGAARLQAAYLQASSQITSAGAWDGRAFVMAAVRALLPWRGEGRGELAETMRGQLMAHPVRAEAEIAALLGLSELAEQLGAFGERGLKATALRRDLEIKACGGREPSEVPFLGPHEDFEDGIEGGEGAAELGERLRAHLEHDRAAVALMLHCEMIDADGAVFEGRKAAAAAEVAALLGLRELDESVWILSDARFKQATVTLDAAAALSGGARVGGQGED